MAQHNKFVVLISGNGSNLKAMCITGLSTQIAAVISNKSDARGLLIAKEYKIPTHIIEHKNYSNRDSFDAELIKQIERYSPKLVVLAGFMRILSDKFVNFYKNRLLNVHPSILPAFIGSNAIENALKANVKVTGVTIHLVTAVLDSGPILAQGIVPISSGETLESLSKKIHSLEHILYPFVIKKFLDNKIIIDNAPEKPKVSVQYKVDSQLRENGTTVAFDKQNISLYILREDEDIKSLQPLNQFIFY